MDHRPGPLACLGRNDCTAQSVVKALDNFLGSVQQMHDVVMVPNKLKDMNAVRNFPAKFFQNVSTV